MRLLIVSNRLPVSIKKEEHKLVYAESVGGLVTGVYDYLRSQLSTHEQITYDQYLWIGWPGIDIEDKDKETVKNRLLQEFHSYPVFLSEENMDKFYHGFCNKTLWPLFHYFPSIAVYDADFWKTYVSVNQDFLQVLKSIIQENDVVWIHDYQLMLLPEMVRKEIPNIRIGFFLHIPFPSYEIFRLLPNKWREGILSGILGADLIGFHTDEYNQYFLGCVHRILGYEHTMGRLFIDDRVIKSDTFPMGISFEKFNTADDLPAVKEKMEVLKKTIGDAHAILSIDRLDYTKGILNRLYGFETFLENNPEWHKKVIFILIVVPSRTGIEDYQQINKQINEIVGKVNGKFADIHSNWLPIIYQYRYFDFLSLVAFYKSCDIALLTPLRDGMNLVAKEYVAARRDKTGTLILSEMTGAAKELGEAIIINPNAKEEIAASLKTALSLSKEEQMHRNQVMQCRLRTYDIIRWAEDFLQSLHKVYEEKSKFRSRFMSRDLKDHLLHDFRTAKNKIIFLDYDGTLTPLVKYPHLAKPSADLLELLRKLSSMQNLVIVLISGRRKSILQEWFPISSLDFVAEHGAWIKEGGLEWQMLRPMSNAWKAQLIPLLQRYTDRLPGSFVEDKDFSISWHYRGADAYLATIRSKELCDDLVNFTANTDVQVIQGNKIIEVRNIGINKGAACVRFLSKKHYDFIMAIGDDVTDEDMFQSLPNGATSIKVGLARSQAKYNLHSSIEVVELLKSLS